MEFENEFKYDGELFFKAECDLEKAKVEIDDMNAYYRDLKEKIGAIANLQSGNESSIFKKETMESQQYKFDDVKNVFGDMYKSIISIRESVEAIDSEFAGVYARLLDGKPPKIVDGIVEKWTIDDLKEEIINEPSFILDENSGDNSDNNDRFQNLTDKEYNKFGMISWEFVNNPELFQEHKGQQLVTLVKLVKDKNGNVSYTNILDPAFNDFTIEEVVLDIHGKAGVLVLKDLNGNYTLVFPCTGSTSDDAVYDGAVFLGIDGNVGDFLSFPTLDILTGVPIVKAVTSTVTAGVITEKSMVSSVAEDYFEKAKDEGKQLNFYGFSKGGGLAEYAYVSLAKKLDSDERAVLGDVVVYNPLHDTLSNKEVNILKESGDFTVYRNQGDLVSTYNHEHTFDEQTIFIHCDWANVMESVEAPTDTDDGFFMEASEALGSSYRPEAAMILEHNRANVSYAVRGGPHGVGAAEEQWGFDELGNSIYNPDSYLYTGDNGMYEQEDVLIYLFGIDDVEWLKHDVNSLLFPEKTAIQDVVNFFTN